MFTSSPSVVTSTMTAQYSSQTRPLDTVALLQYSLFKTDLYNIYEGKVNFICMLHESM